MPRYAYELNGKIYTVGEDDEPPPQPVGTFESGVLWVSGPSEEDVLEDEAYRLNAIHDAEDEFDARLSWRTV